MDKRFSAVKRGLFFGVEVYRKSTGVLDIGKSSGRIGCMRLAPVWSATRQGHNLAVRPGYLPSLTTHMLLVRGLSALDLFLGHLRPGSNEVTLDQTNESLVQ
jgi:hypothetical protein